MKWLNDFPKPSIENRLRLLSKESKGKDVSQFDWQSIEGVRLSPFISEEDRMDHRYINQVPVSNRKTWTSLAPIRVEDERKSNTELLKLLNAGANGLSLHLKNQSVNWGALLRGVHLDLIELKINSLSNSQNIFDSFMGYVAINSTPIEKLNVSFFCDELIMVDNSYNNIRYRVCNVNVDKKLITTLAKELAQLDDLIRNGIHSTSSILNRSFLNVYLSNDYVSNIAAVRAIHSLLFMMKKAHHEEALQIPVLASVTEEALHDDPYQNMIRLPIIALSGVLGGADSIELHAKMDSLDQERIIGNIHSILQMECHLDEVIDPLAGSYFIDNLTYQIVTASWEQFLKLINERYD